MQYISGFVRWINDFLNYFAWGPATLFLLAGSGILFSVGTGFFQVRKIKLWWKKTLGSSFGKKKEGKSQGLSGFQSACTALAATLGTGNIAGVATAIAAGGPGAVFWMWLSAFFGTMTGYAENVLAGLYKGKSAKGEPIGGAMFYIEQGLGFRWLALLFSFFCILGSLGMGDMAQANSIATGMQDAFGLSPWITGITVAGMVAFAVMGGIQRVGKITEKIVPFMALAYTGAAVLVIAVNWQRAPQVFAMIFEQAFSWKAGFGGLAGYGAQQAIRIGVARGVSSNEAGLGSSVMANSAATSCPVEQGMWGVFEVVVDTLLMCTLTALAILCSGVYDMEQYSSALGTPHFSELPNGTALTAQAFRSVFGEFGGVLIAISLMLFAFSTLLGWSYYGERAVEYLFGAKMIPVYKVVYIGCIIIGCVAKLDLVWQISDTFNGLMIPPNLLAVLWLSPQVFRETKRYFSQKTAHST